MPIRHWGSVSAGDLLAFPSQLEALNTEECFRRLALGSVGRVAYTEGALPAITPVRYAVSDRSVFFWPQPDSELRRAISGVVVAFEADRLHAETGAGWTVLVVGIARPSSGPSQAAARDLVPPWETFVITPGLVRGRRLRGH